MHSRPVRSALFLPASNARAIEKARTLPCDVAILDLEDAVAPEAKAQTREQATTALTTGTFASGSPIVRINDLDSPWGKDDLAALRDARPRAVLLPKVSSPHALADCRDRLPDTVKLWAMIETCTAILHIDAIAAAGRSLGLEGFIVGANDLAKEMRCRPGPLRTPLLTALSLTVMAARAHGIIVLDSVYNDFRDEAGLRAECAQGAEFGFDGKSLIHPGQIAIANEMFSPSEHEIAQARAIVAAFALPENAGKGVITVEGKMTELLHLAQAQQTLALARAPSA